MNQTISIAKSIAIILMVIGHSGAPELMTAPFSVIRMPLFFFVSGFLFKDKYLDTPIDFVKRKVKGLYVPFVKWSLIFLILHNLFYCLGFYNTTYTLAEIGHKAIWYTIMMGSEQLLGGFWFLKELLIVSLVCCGILLIVNRLKMGGGYLGNAASVFSGCIYTKYSEFQNSIYK